MHTYDKNPDEKKRQSVATAVSTVNRESESTFMDNRPEAVAQRKLQTIMYTSPHVTQLQSFQAMADRQMMNMSYNNMSGNQKKIQGNFEEKGATIQRVPVSNSNMKVLFGGGRNGNEWFFWGKAGYHVGAIRESDGSGEVSEFHVKKEFKGAKTNRIDWVAAGETYNEVDPPNKWEHDDPEVLGIMRSLGKETKDLLIEWRKKE